MKLKALVAGLAGSVMFASVGMAADVPVIVPPAPPPIVVAPAVPGFDWSGLYFGGSVERLEGRVIGGQVGFNIVRGNLLFGAEGRLGLIAGSALTFGGAARAGLVVGRNGRLVLYGVAGVEVITGVGVTVVTGAAGAEIGIGQRFSVFGEVGALGVPGSGCCETLLRAGFNFHL